MARAVPTSRGRVHVPPESGTSPSFEKDWMKRRRARGDDEIARERDVRAGTGGNAIHRPMTGIGRLRSASTSGL